MTKHKLGKIESPLGKMDEDTNSPLEHKSPLKIKKKTKSPLNIRVGKKCSPLCSVLQGSGKIKKSCI